MNSEYFLLVLAQKSLKQLKPKISELEGFYNQLGYAFPWHRKSEVEALFKGFDPKTLKIIEQPLQNQSFESYRQSHKVDFYRRSHRQKVIELSQLQEAFSFLSPPTEEEIEATPRLSEQEKELWLLSLHEEAELRERLSWAESIEKTMEVSPKTMSLKFLSDLETNYLESDAPQKPRLLYWTDKNGVKHTFLPKEIVSMLVGAGGVGKTHLLAHLALCITTGIPFLGRFEIEKPGSVCLVLGENKMDDIHRLLRKSAKGIYRMLEENKKRPEHLQFGLFDPFPMKTVPGKLCVSTVHGMNSHFLFEGKPTSFYREFLEQLKKKQPREGWSLILLDPISRFAGLDSEKDNAVATDFIALLERMSDELNGNPTILVSHHKPKPSVGNKESDQTAARGASGLTDGVRWQANLDKQDDKLIVFRVVKSNFTSIPPDFRIKKLDDGTLVYDGETEIHAKEEKKEKYGPSNSTHEIMKKLGVHGVS